MIGGWGISGMKETSVFYSRVFSLLSICTYWFSAGSDPEGTPALGSLAVASAVCEYRLKGKKSMGRCKIYICGTLHCAWIEAKQ